MQHKKLLVVKPFQDRACSDNLEGLQGNIIMLLKHGMERPMVSFTVLSSRCLLQVRVKCEACQKVINQSY